MCQHLPFLTGRKRGIHWTVSHTQLLWLLLPMLGTARGQRRTSTVFSHDGSTKLMEVFMQSETKELIYSIYTRIQMTYLYICQLIIIRNCNVIMMSKISCFWISPKFHHLFGPGRPGFIELLPRDMEPTRRCLACSCLWCYACGCICGIRHTSFLNIFKY